MLSFFEYSEEERAKLVNSLEREVSYVRDSSTACLFHAVDYAGWATAVFAHLLGRYAMPYTGDVTYSLDEM